MRKVITITMLFVFLGCEQQLKQARDNAQIPDQISKTIQDYVNDPSKSVEELEKLNQVEYNVFSLPAENSSAKYEGILDQMGKKRWDCFHVENVKTISEAGKTESTLLFFCKRTPDTLLRYIPKSLLGR